MRLALLACGMMVPMVSSAYISNLIVNGGFETGATNVNTPPASWSEIVIGNMEVATRAGAFNPPNTSGLGATTTRAFGAAPQGSNIGAVWESRSGISTYAQLFQTFTVPLEVRTGTLTFSMDNYSNAGLSTTSVTVRPVIDITGISAINTIISLLTPIETFVSVTGTNDSGGFQNYSFDLTSLLQNYEGQEIVLAFTSSSLLGLGGRVTNLAIDNVRLIADYGPGGGGTGASATAVAAADANQRRVQQQQAAAAAARVARQKVAQQHRRNQQAN